MKILDRLPIPTERTSLRFDGRFVVVHPNQILVWVSVHMAGPIEPEKNLPRFPALLDTGNNFAFSLQDRHLREWAGIDPGLLAPLGDITIEGKIVKCRRAAVWLYPNVPGRHDVASDRPPLGLKLSKGIAVYPQDQVPPARGCPCWGSPPYSTTTSIAGSIPSGSTSRCSPDPGAGG